MWNQDNNKERNHPSTSTVTAVGTPTTVDERRTTAWIGQGVTIKGDVIGSEDLIIDGKVEGRIELPDHHLTIGVGAGIKADLVAKKVTIGGAVVGNVTASERILIRETGSVDGNIAAPRFSMSDGAVLKGSVETGRPHAAAKREQPLTFPVAV